MAAGILLVLLGAFLVARTLTRDATGRTLIDRLLGAPAGKHPASEKARQ
jgi:hypothetical protein